nr:MAG TPA: hypothetical protein [Caudoviricetes sp.]
MVGRQSELLPPCQDRPSPQKCTDLNRPAQSLNNAGHTHWRRWGRGAHSRKQSW